MRKVVFALLSILSACSTSYAQQYYFQGDELWRLCPWLTNSYRLDSSARQMSVDSAAHLLVGRWRLVESAGGWAPRIKPEKVTELVFNREIEGKVYEDSLLVSMIQLYLKRGISAIDFNVDQKGKPIFSFLTPRISRRGKGLVPQGSLIVCEDRMFFFTGADGPAYAFRCVP